MNKHHKRRIIFICIFALGSSVAVGLILFAFKQNINVFLTPTDVTQAQIQSDYTYRLGGMIKTGSLQQSKNSLNHRFVISDLKKDIAVNYHGSLPDLFREGKGAVITGHFKPSGEFIATQVLAKHDENYMPPKVAKALGHKVKS